MVTDYKKNIEITNNYNKQILIGKNIFFSCDRYNDALKKELYSWIDIYFSDVSNEKKEEILYHSIYDYWVYGNDIVEELYFDFLNKNHDEKSKYITMLNRLKYYEFLNDKSNEIIFADKYKTYTTFKDYYKREIIELKDKNDYQKYLNFISRHTSFIVKPSSLALGIGVYKEELINWKDSKELFKHLIKYSEKAKEYSWSANNKLVLEEEIVQDKRMSKFGEKSVNIVRITTLVTNDRVKFLFACLRCGIGDNNITSTVAGELFCGINIKTGKIDTNGFKEDSRMYINHPNTNIPLMGSVIPEWEVLLNVAQKAAKIVPSVRYVGWDFALSNNGWVIVEGNEHGDFVNQLVYKKPYKEEFEKIINYR